MAKYIDSNYKGKIVKIKPFSFICTNQQKSPNFYGNFKVLDVIEIRLGKDYTIELEQDGLIFSTKDMLEIID